MSMKFRCCGNRSVEGHAADCPIKGSEAGCQFDILHFKHIGECKGTCDGDEGVAQFAGNEAEGGILHIILVDLSNATLEQLRDLEKRGLRRLTDEELFKIVELHARGDLEVEVTTMTLTEREEALPKEKPDDPFLTIHTAALALGFSDGWVRTLCRDGRLPGALKLMRKWAIPESVIFVKEEA